MKQIAAALVVAQRNFAPALKTSNNPHFKSRYADLAACIESVMDALNGAGIYLMQPVHDDASGVTVETLFIHESGETLSAGRLHVPAAKQDPQGYGSALTYARRYSLMAACGIAPEDDDGNAASRKKEGGNSPPPKTSLTEATVADFLIGIKDAADMADLIHQFGLAYTAAQGAQDGFAAKDFKEAYETRKAALEKVAA